jgi:hypothetical protein
MKIYAKEILDALIYRYNFQRIPYKLSEDYGNKKLLLKSKQNIYHVI